MKQGASIHTYATVAAGPLLFGDQTIESTVPYTAAGQAEAFSFYGATGTAQSITVYVDSHTTSTKLLAGIYLANPGLNGAPRIASGSLSTLTKGAWNTITIPSTSVTSSNVYWISILGTGGKLYFRGRSPGLCTAYMSSQTTLTSLPTSFSQGASKSACPASVYVSGGALQQPANTALPAVSGTTTQGQTLATTSGNWSNSPTGYSYQWQDCDTSGANCANITGATASTYTLASGDAGHPVRSRATATNAAGSTTASSVPTSIVAPPAGGGTPSVSVGTISNVAPVYATFQSHDRRTLATADGLFLSYFTNYNCGSPCDLGPPGSGDDIVAHSTDNGSTWTTLVDIPIGGHSPATLETDSTGNVYAFLQSTTWTSGGSGTDARMYLFPKTSNFANDGTNYLELQSGNVGANKFAATYDPAVNKFFFVSQYYMETVTINSSTNAAADTASHFQFQNFDGSITCGAVLHYPSLYTDRSGSGLLLLSYTTTSLSNGASYYDNRFIVSTDHGAHWQGPNGNLSFPTDMCNSTTSWQINPTGEPTVGGRLWLDGSYIQSGKFLFMSSNGVGRAEYRRFDWASKTFDVSNTSGSCISTGSLCPGWQESGFFSSAGTANSRIYWTGPATGGMIAILSSDDNGATWQDFAQSGSTPNLYALAGSPTLGPGGEVIGAYVDETSATTNTNALNFVKTIWK